MLAANLIHCLQTDEGSETQPVGKRVTLTNEQIEYLRRLIGMDHSESNQSFQSNLDRILRDAYYRGFKF